MAYRTLMIEELNNLLQQWNGEKVKIVKHEINDVDEIYLDLHNISYVKEDSIIDGYESQYSMHLNGAGMIETTLANYESLPSEVYEIPLENDALYEFNGSRFILSTSRGVYTIERSEVYM